MRKSRLTAPGFITSPDWVESPPPEVPGPWSRRRYSGFGPAGSERQRSNRGSMNDPRVGEKDSPDRQAGEDLGDRDLVEREAGRREERRLFGNREVDGVRRRG